MPRYDYHCAACGETQEGIFPMADVPPAIPCPCGTAHAARVFSPPAAIHFHGPGFYTTDVKKRLNTRRRPNPGDDLHKDFDHGAAKIADAI